MHHDARGLLVGMATVEVSSEPDEAERGHEPLPVLRS
jgi:hypothetical protein